VIPKDCCPICALHGRMRVTECLFNSLQAIAIELNRVDEVNAILKACRARYQIKKDRKSGSTTYKPCSLNGGPASTVIACAPSIIKVLLDPSTTVLELPAELGDQASDLQDSASAVEDLSRALSELWVTWARVDETLSALRPSRDLVRDAGKNLCRLAVQWEGEFSMRPACEIRPLANLSAVPATCSVTLS
jgi:hypothetical protein